MAPWAVQLMQIVVGAACIGLGVLVMAKSPASTTVLLAAGGGLIGLAFPNATQIIEARQKRKSDPPPPDAP